MHKFILFIFYSLFVSSSFCQSYKKKDLLIEPYIGFPNWSNSSISVSLLSPKVKLPSVFSELNYNDYGPLGLKSEYFLTSTKSLGIDFFLKGYQLSGAYLSDSTLNTQTQVYDKKYMHFKYTVNRVRIQLRYNYHFVKKNPKFDSYIGFGVGYNGNFSFLTTKDESKSSSIDDKIKNGSSSGKLNSFNSSLIPFSMRICYGFHYNFTENFGLNTEVGIGGSTFLLGLSLKY